MIVAPSTTLPRGTPLYRVGDPAYALSFTWLAPAQFRGGRFDCVDGSYGYCYLADHPAVALAEAFTRDFASTPHLRTLPAARLSSAVLVSVETVVEIDVQLLHGRQLTSIGETTALTKSDPDAYARTREVAVGLVAGHPSARGLRYRPRSWPGTTCASSGSRGQLRRRMNIVWRASTTVSPRLSTISAVCRTLVLDCVTR